ncbi:9374_t:CDS:10 [Entrophospora sp. SA101]|nr:9374_t:CDS:10 [Entrophospora sp. SA101]
MSTAEINQSNDYTSKKNILLTDHDDDDYGLFLKNNSDIPNHNSNIPNSILNKKNAKQPRTSIDSVSSERTLIFEEPDEEYLPTQNLLDQRINNEFLVLMIIVSIISYVVGYYDLTFVWLKRGDGETVEWLNYLLQQVWRTFDPSLLIGLRDMLEDAMSRSSPSFVKATDIESFEIGLIAPRIQNIKILARREDEDDEDIGEATFSFRAKSSAHKPQDSPPHILAWIKTGISATIPIKVELTGFVASIHFEIKITGGPPFLSTCRFSFLKFPIYETSIMPLIPMNIAQFPIIKQFIRNTVQTVLEEFTYPKFIDIDLEQMLSGDDILHDTETLGIMRVDIYEARNLTKVDVHGENDPYVMLSLDPAPYAHTHMSTRVIENCASPIWHETFFLKMPQMDIVDEHVKFKLGVMDWDRLTTDDHIGSMWIDIKDYIGNGDKQIKIHDGWATLHQKPTDPVSHGQLKCRLEFFPKLPNDMTDPSLTAGILGLQIHQGMNLQLTAAPYNDDSSTISMADNHYNINYPNPYVVVYLNDAIVYRTRAKLNNIAPYWNASTEQFVKDWRKAIVRVVVKDQKDLEYDPVIGMVTVQLKDIFDKKDKKKELSKWYPLRHGVGCGKVRLSFLFKAIDIKLPPEERGYDVGTLFAHSFVAEDLHASLRTKHNLYLVLSLNQSEIKLTTQVSKRSNPPTWLCNNDNNNDQSTSHSNDNNQQEQFQVAIFKRYRTSLIVKVKRRGIFGMNSTVGVAELRLKNITDCLEQEIEVPIFEGYDPNFILENDFKIISGGNDDLDDCGNGSEQEGVKKGNSDNDNVGNKSRTTASCNSSAASATGDSSKKAKSLSSEVDGFADNANNCDDDNDDQQQHQEEVSNSKIDNNNNSGSHQNDSNNITTQNTPTTTTTTIADNSTSTSATIADASNNSTSAVNNHKHKVIGHLKFKVYFKPGLSLAHEEDVKKKLTGADISILFNNSNDNNSPSSTVCGDYESFIHNNNNDMMSTRERGLRKCGGGGEVGSDERRINRVHSRKTMRQLQWFKDLLKAKVVLMAGKRNWEEYDKVEQEL